MIPKNRAMRVRWPDRGAVVLSVLWALLVAIQGLPAQQTGARPGLRVEFGYGGHLWPSRWVPATVHVASGTEPFDGTLMVSYDQDSTQSTQIIRQVAGTPGKITPVQVMVNLPVSCSRIAFTLRDRSGRTAASVVHARHPDGNEQPMPDSGGGGGVPPAPVVVGIGAATGPASSVSRVFDRRTGASAIATGAVQTALLPAEDMPLAWAGYDGVLLAAVENDGADGADPRAIAALREWVSGGGRLVIFAATAGDGWRRWLPPFLGDSITLAEPVTGPLPVELRAAIRRKLPVSETDREGALRRLEQGDQRQPPLPHTDPPDPAPPAPQPKEPLDPEIASYAPADGAEADAAPLKPTPADSLVQRRIELGSAAVAAGWSLRWTHDTGAGLLAEGPVGFGWVTIVGLDPRRATILVSDAGTRLVWADVVTNIIADWLVANTPDSSVPAGGRVWYMQSGQELGSLAQTGAAAWSSRSAALDRVAAAVGDTGHGLFPMIAGAMLLLAALIGPVDAMLLRRLRLRHRSWATALGWIGIATAAAYFAPTLGRGSQTSISRITVVDAIVPPPAATDAGSLVPALAWRTGVTGVFAGRSMQRQFEGRTAGSWWRPISATQEYYYGREAGSLSQSTLHVQTTPDLSTLAAAEGQDDPWGGLGLGPGVGGNAPGPMWLRLWTLRMFQDQGRIVPSVRVSVEGLDGAGNGPTVQVEGLPAACRIKQAALHARGVWTSLAAPPSSTTDEPAARSVRLVGAEGAASVEPARPWSLGGTSANQSNHRPRDPTHPGPMLGLPGTERRAAAIERLIGTGRWATVYLEVVGVGPDVRLSDTPDAATEQTTIYRLLVPLPEPQRDPT